MLCIGASVIWNSGKWNSVKWNETRRTGAILHAFASRGFVSVSWAFLYARPYVFTFYVTFIPVTVCECHIELKSTWLGLTCLVLGWVIRVRRVEWRYFRFEQIQDGGRRHIAEISNGHISTTGRPIHFLFSFKIYAFYSVVSGVGWVHWRVSLKCFSS